MRNWVQARLSIGVPGMKEGPFGAGISILGAFLGGSSLESSLQVSEERERSPYGPP